MEPPLNVVYVKPEIPQNTGSTARLCAATGIPLHLVGRLGFRIDDRAVKRAGLDYWKHVTVVRHRDFDSLRAEAGDAARFLLFSKTAKKLYSEAEYRKGDYLVFGSETKGLPPEIMEAYSETCYRIPILPGVRSLNLATSTGIVVFEALRALGFPHMENA
ncbi:MAG TPA: tRNA (cytidine(34)-2'-O)-methyltransferase [bacterium]|nr:tRNA (cytidine(34)-2'-O)-methyltransferase [bacterium]